MDSHAHFKQKIASQCRYIRPYVSPVGKKWEIVIKNNHIQLIIQNRIFGLHELPFLAQLPSTLFMVYCGWKLVFNEQLNLEE